MPVLLSFFSFSFLCETLCLLCASVVKLFPHARNCQFDSTAASLLPSAAIGATGATGSGTTMMADLILCSALADAINKKSKKPYPD